MKLIRPFTVTPSNLTSNVVEIPPAAYNAGTTYAEGDQVSVMGGVSNTEATVYESLQAGNVGNTPASSPAWWQPIGIAYLAWNSGTNYSVGATVTENHRLYEAIQSGTNHPVTDISWWIDLGPSNEWAMFDESVSTQTIRPYEIMVEIAANSRVDSIALLNVDASDINIKVLDGVDVVFDQDYSMISGEGILDWFQYYFEPVTRLSDLFITGLPNVGNPTIVITAIDGDDVAIGNVILGLSYDIGKTAYGASVGIIDYSRVTRDDFGNGTIVRRGFNRRGRFMVWLEKANVDAVYNLLSDFRATPTLLIGTDAYTSTFIYGLIKDWEITIDYPRHSVMTIETEGL